MIPSFDIKRQNTTLYRELNRVIKEVLTKGVYILGKKVDEFEAKFASYLGVKYTVGVASGTDALSLALLAIGINPGDEVIMPANAYPTAFAVTAIGAIPKLVDIDPSTFNIDPSLIEQAITSKTKAILPVHLYGLPCDMRSIMRIAGKHNLKVIEDCAQAVGSSIKYQAASSKYNAKIKNKLATNYLLHTTTQFQEQKVGSFGDAGCFSFYPTKNLGCFGDGGMVVTNDKEIYDKVKLLRMYGEKTRYNSVVLGRNSRLDELQAAILLVKLKYLDKWNERRRGIAEKYYQSFRYQILSTRRVKNKMESINLPHLAGPTESAEVGHDFFPHLPNSPRSTGLEAVGVLKKHGLPADSFFHVYHLFVIRTKKRDQLKKHLEEKGIQTAIHYPVPIHLVPSMKYLGYRKGDFPVAEELAGQILSLPMFPELTDLEIEKVVSAINVFYL